MSGTLERPAVGARRQIQHIRREKHVPLSARLFLDPWTNSDVATISRDLYTSLFGRDAEQNQDTNPRYIAVTPWRPVESVKDDECAWTIIPVFVDENAEVNSVVKFSVSATQLQSFLIAAQLRHNDHRFDRGFEILVQDVQPLILDTVFVRVDGDALRKHEEVQRKFGGGFQSQQNGVKSKGASQPLKAPTGPPIEERLETAIRSAISSLMVVQRRARLNIPLPNHPITHAPFPPVEIILCEPVDQGLVSGNTQVVVEITSGPKQTQASPITTKPSAYVPSIQEEDEDSAGEDHYSAVPNGRGRKSSMSFSVDHQRSVRDSSSDSPDSDDDEDDDDASSEDEPDEIISLSSPTLPKHVSGIMTGMSVATPRANMRGMTGVHTPGSIVSNFTVTAGHPGGSSRTFKAKLLLAPIHDALLHPTPPSQEDEEARIYVDIRTLMKLGCFSGDWVRISGSSGNSARDRFLSFDRFDNDDENVEFRVVKIYGLPQSTRTEGQSRPRDGRQPTLMSLMPGARPSPDAYLPPVLYHNLGKPSTIAVSPLSFTENNERRFTRSKLSSTATPPTAKEITLLRVPTPLATERVMQTSILVSLKRHFEQRTRLVKKGDLIAIGFDAQRARIISDSKIGTGQNDPSFAEFLASGVPGTMPLEEITNLAWFKVGTLSSRAPGEEESEYPPEVWGETFVIEPFVTRMVQASNEPGRLPTTEDVPWRQYYRLEKLPASYDLGANTIHIKNSDFQTYKSKDCKRLMDLLGAALSPRATALKMRPIVILLHSMQRGIGKTHLVEQACSCLGAHMFPVDAYDILTDGGAGAGDLKTEASLRARVERALMCGAEHTVPVIQHAEVLTADRVANALSELLKDVRALVLTTTDIDKIPDAVRGFVTHEILISAPDEHEREGILRGLVTRRGIRLAYDVQLTSIAMKTAALVASDLQDVVERVSLARQERLKELVVKANEQIRPDSSQVLIRDVIVSGGSAALNVLKADFDVAVDAARKNFADAIGAPKIPSVTWDDVGGLAHIKDAVMETIQLPLERPELFAKGMKKRSGILFYGPPGTGKTLLAKAIATEFSLNFFSVKGPELLNMYIGESEANVRRVFQKARDARPCVVFFDELDSVAPKRGNQGDSGGVMDRIVSQLLAELDGMSSGGEEGQGGGAGVFVIGATNRPDLLDQALLRPGRFDKMLYLGVADTHDKQLKILEALTRKFTLDPALSLKSVSDTLPFTYTGADLYALCSDAMLKAVTRQANAVDEKIKKMASEGVKITTAQFFDRFAKKEDIAVVVKQEDFMAAQRELVASVSAKEFEHYDRVRKTFEASDKSAANGQSQLQPGNAQPPSSSSNSARPTSTYYPANSTSTSNASTMSRQPSGTATNTSTSTAPSISTSSSSGIRNKLRSLVGTKSGNPASDMKGKGKARQTPTQPPNLNMTSSAAALESDEDEAYVTSYDGSTSNRQSSTSLGVAKVGSNTSGYGATNGNGNANGSVNGKGKAGFRDAAEDDEEDLYGH